MLTKQLIGSKNYFRFQLLASNAYDFNFTSSKIKNYNILQHSHSIQDSKPLCSINQNNKNKYYLQNLKTQCFLPIQSFTRYKTTGSTTDPQETVTTEKTGKSAKEIPSTRAEKLKKAVKEYGTTVIVFHVGISLISLGTCYILVTSGLDVTKIFDALGLDEYVTKSQVAASAGTFAVAYAIHKVFAPVRITITLASVPLIVRYLRKIGFLRHK